MRSSRRPRTIIPRFIYPSTLLSLSENKSETPEPSNINPLRNVHVYDGKLEHRPNIPKYDRYN
jgi:hypothetical protein